MAKSIRSTGNIVNIPCTRFSMRFALNELNAVKPLAMLGTMAN